MQVSSTYHLQILLFYCLEIIAWKYNKCNRQKQNQIRKEPNLLLTNEFQFAMIKFPHQNGDVQLHILPFRYLSAKSDRARPTWQNIGLFTVMLIKPQI